MASELSGSASRCLPGACLARGANEIAGTALGLDEPAGAYRQAGSALEQGDEGAGHVQDMSVRTVLPVWLGLNSRRHVFA